MQIPTPRLPASVLAFVFISLGQIPLLLASPKGTDTMHIDRNGSLPSSKGPPEYFTGNVRIDMQFQREAPSRAAGATVTFEPGARTAWHSHPLGQTLIVTSGKGWTQCEGWSGRRDQRWRHHLVPARPSPLARCHAQNCDDAYRHPGSIG